MSKLYAFQFQRRLLKFSFFVPIFQFVTPGAEPVLTPVALHEQTKRCYVSNIKALCLPVFLLCSYVQTCDPWGRANCDPRGIIWTNLVEVHLEMLHTKINIKALYLLVSEKIFKYFAFFFLFCCHGTQSYGWNYILWTIFVEFHPRNIPAKFNQDWPCGFGEEDVQRNCWRTTDDRHKVIKIAKNNEMLDLSKLKAFADNKINKTEKFKFVIGWVETLWEKGKILVTSIFSFSLNVF